MVRDSDLVARFGGDEFVVLQYPVQRPRRGGGARAADRRGAGRASTRSNGHQLVIGASVGIAIAPQDGKDADLLLKNADMALYRAKSDGRGAVALLRARDGREGAGAPQPRTRSAPARSRTAPSSFTTSRSINLKTGRISTCEALLRWPHPERGMVSPAEFIPIAEEIGPDRRDRRLGAAPAPASNARDWPSAGQRRGQPLADPVPARQHHATPSRRRSPLRSRAEPAGDRDHRIRPAAGHRGDPRDSCGRCAISASGSRSTISAPAIRA